MIPIVTKLLPISKRRSGQKLLGVSYLCSHDTGNPGSTASGNANYFFNSANEMKASAHYFVDDKNIIQIIPDSEKAWHVRYVSPKDNEIYGKDFNDWAIGIELCYGGQVNNQKAYQNYVELHAYLCQKYNLIPEKHIVGHYTLDPGRRNDPLNAFTFLNKTWIGFIFDVSNLMQKPIETKCEQELKDSYSFIQKLWAFILALLSKK